VADAGLQESGGVSGLADQGADARIEIVRTLTAVVRAAFERRREAATLDLTTTPPARAERAKASGRRTE
jgi:hypothetical protein